MTFHWFGDDLLTQPANHPQLLISLIPSVLNTTKLSSFHHLNFSPPHSLSSIHTVTGLVQGLILSQGNPVIPSKWADHSHRILARLLLKVLQWQPNSWGWSLSTCSVSPFNLPLTYYLQALPEYLQFPDNLQFETSMFACAIPTAGMCSAATHTPNPIHPEKSFLSFKIQLKGLPSVKTFPIPLFTPHPRTIIGRPTHWWGMAILFEVTVVPSYQGSYISKTRLIQIGRDWLSPLFGELYLFNVTSSLLSTNLLFPPAV